MKEKKKDKLIDWIESEEYPTLNEVEGEDQSEAGGKLKAATQMLEDKKQLILYGPPGTSKTFFAKRLAIWLAEKETPYTEEEVNEKFEELKKDDKTALVQFHPSYSYEDFIEGYRPQVDGDYELEDGIFKKMCEELSKKKLEEYSEGYFALVDRYERANNAFDIPDHVKGSLNRQHSINKVDQSDFEAVVEDSDLQSLFEEEEKLSSYYILRLKEDSPYSDIEEERYHFSEGIAGSKQLPEDLAEGKAGFLYYDPERGGIFGGGTLHDLEESTVEETEEKKILIIDEINRAEIAKVLGELIYGLEYRGESIDLQYSDNPLKIPENLYLIGTMNTADRSIALVDAAIRRRFSFIQKMPDYDLLTKHLELRDEFDEESLLEMYGENDKIDLKILSILALNHINEKILEEERLGREKQVGHTYLMRLKGKDIKRKFLMAWKNDILPLLEEYYYFNYDQLQEIFSDSDKLMDEKKGIKDFDADDLKDVLEKMCEI